MPRSLLVALAVATAAAALVCLATAGGADARALDRVASALAARDASRAHAAASASLAASLAATREAALWSAHAKEREDGFEPWVKMFCGVPRVAAGGLVALASGASADADDDAEDAKEAGNTKYGFVLDDRRVTCTRAGVPTEDGGVYEWGVAAPGAVPPNLRVVYVGKADFSLRDRCDAYNTPNPARVGAHQKANFRAELKAGACFWYRWRVVKTLGRVPSVAQLAESELMRKNYAESPNNPHDAVYDWNTLVTAKALAKQKADVVAYQKVVEARDREHQDVRTKLDDAHTALNQKDATLADLITRANRCEATVHGAQEAALKARAELEQIQRDNVGARALRHDFDVAKQDVAACRKELADRTAELDNCKLYRGVCADDFEKCKGLLRARGVFVAADTFTTPAQMEARKRRAVGSGATPSSSAVGGR